MIEPLPAFRDDQGRVRISDDMDLLVEAVAVASALGPTSAYTWLKLPAPSDPERMMAATTLPALLLGGDPGDRAAEMVEGWRRAMKIPNVRGLVAGRSLIFPADGDIERWVDDAVSIVHGDSNPGNGVMKLHYPAGSLSTDRRCSGDRPREGRVVVFRTAGSSMSDLVRPDG